jgi:DNA-binding transcriptional LysR family regulator
MARDVMGPLMRRFVDAQPELRVDIQPYSSPWDQEPKEDIDIFFKIRAPRDSLKRVHRYPSAKRALYASKSYVRKYGLPNDPAELSNHRVSGRRVLWQLETDQRRKDRRTGSHLSGHVLRSVG